MVKQLAPHTALYRCSRTGIAWVEDGSTGLRYSAHSNISDTGSVRGMRGRGWGKNDRVVRTHGFYYNIDQTIANDRFSELARRMCSCGGRH